MNHLTFNEDLLLPQDFHAMDADGSLTRTMPDSLLGAPIFVWDDFEDDKLVSLPDNRDVTERLISEENLLPFRQLRIFVRSNLSDSKDGTRGFKAWISHQNGSLRALVAMQGPKKLDGIMGIFTDGTISDGGFKGWLRFGKQITKESDFPEPLRGQLRDHMQAVWTSICWFIREASSSANFLAAVLPDKKGKSVEWMRVRTHYVLIHKAHPANRKEFAVGDKVAFSHDSAKRQAHTRRAHARVLRSPRFRNKVGQTIQVKACWVGPEEWRQFGSIYRLVR